MDSYSLKRKGREKGRLNYLLTYAELALSRGNIEKANSLCDECLNHKINSYPHLVKLGEFCEKIGKLEDAIDCFEKAKDLKEDKEITLLTISAYEKLLEKGKKELAYNIGLLYETLGDMEENTEHYMKAKEFYELAIENGDKIGYFGLGNVYAILNDLKNAEINYQNFLSYFPEDIDAKYNLILVKLGLSKLDEANELAKSLIENPKTNPELKKELSDLLKIE